MPFLSPMLCSHSYRIAPSPKKAKVIRKSEKYFFVLFLTFFTFFLLFLLFYKKVKKVRFFNFFL